MPVPQGPLAGIRVLDFSSFLAGPTAAQLLGDMGADVVKVEPPTGDLGRTWSPFIAGESRFFLAWNRNKRSIAIDLTTDAGREIVYKLIADTDVVVENFRHGITAKLKIDYETLRERNPKLIYCSSTAFGAKGPQAKRPGYDPVLQSLAGAARGNERNNGGTTAICSVAVSDHQACMLMVSGICAALYYRERTGVGQKLETSLLQAAMSVQSQMFVKALDRKEDGLLGISPYRLFATKDDKIFIAAATDRFWRILCDVIGEPELGTDPAFATNGQRVNQATVLNERLQPRFLEKTTAEWEALLVAAGVPCAAIKTYMEFFDDPQVAAMDMNPVMEHPLAGRLQVSGLPIHFHETPGVLNRPSPLLGQHTKEILAEAGYDAIEIERLIASQTVRQHAIASVQLEAAEPRP
ncbi:MAG: CoA transferase [Bryobacteraceae bacterium]